MIFAIREKTRDFSPWRPKFSPQRKKTEIVSTVFFAELSVAFSPPLYPS